MKHLSRHSGTRHVPTSSRQAGFSMLEVMVTLVVLSTGLLGVANLQVEALRGNQGAYLASVAAQQAQDMAERMNANRAGVDANLYDHLDASIPAMPVNCQSADCTPTNLSVFDHNRWNATNQALLPSGAGQVTEISNGVFLIGVRWYDRKLANANGWQAGTEAATACGAPQAGTRCFFLRHQA
ncbi:MAG: type IV pilus modification protein PilV [Gallionellaceae bacterium]|nr:type IV pilus modification protein PilV [Gallionellaceae bacterium]